MHQRKKAGASALFKTVYTLQPLPIFFFKIFPIILTFEYIIKQTGRLLLPLAPGGFDLCDLCQS